MSGIDLDAVLKGENLIMEGVEKLGGPIFRLDSEVGPAHVAHEKGVACEHEPGLIGTGGVRDCDGDMLRAMAWGVECGEAYATDLYAIAVVEGLMGIFDSRVLEDRYLRPYCSQLAVSRNVVGVVVGLDHPCDAQALLAGKLNVVGDVPLRVNDHAFAHVRISYDIGGATQIIGYELFK